MQNTKITSCRLCKSKELVFLFTLGNHYVNAFPNTLAHDTHRCPITLLECKKCSLIQLADSAPPEILYSHHYWYKSGLNKVIVEDLKDIAREAGKYLEEGDLVLDIGANDGTLLHFMPNSVKKIAVEPARNFTEDLMVRANMVIPHYWPAHVFGYKFKVITAIGMFYDTEDPVAFVQAATDSLAEDGVFIAQLMTAKQMVMNADVGNMCHEHLEFYTWKSLEYLFKKCKLEIFKVEENEINGGSYRIYARHWKKGHIPFKEDKLDLEHFRERLFENKRKTVTLLQLFKEQGKKVYGYGASTKFNTILQFYEVGPELLEGVIDKDPEKIGRYTLTGIPIVKEGFVSDADVLWVGPYGFLSYFKDKEVDYKGQWLVSMPQVKLTK